MDGLIREEGAVPNLGPHLLASLHGQEPAALFKQLHYNEEGNRLVAQALEQALRALPDREGMHACPSYLPLAGQGLD